MMCPFAISAQQQPQLQPYAAVSCPYSTSPMFSMQQQRAAACSATVSETSLSTSRVDVQQRATNLAAQSCSSAEMSDSRHPEPFSEAEVSSSMASSSSKITSQAPPPQTQTDTTPSNSSSSSSSSSSSTDSNTLDRMYIPSTYQHWQMTRPTLNHDPKLTRRQLRRLGRSWTLTDVAQHKYCDDGWIAVEGKVYDITEHLVNHPGWDSGCQVTTVLSILAHLGTDCSEEFRDIHRSYPVAWKQLQAFYIGDLV